MSNSNSIPLPTNPKFEDLTGQVFNRWTVKGYSGKVGRAHFWACQCECGVEREVIPASLKSGQSKSCGCLKHERLVESRTSHGMFGFPEYQSWAGMWARCTNPKSTGFKLYESRRPPDAWKDFQTFFNDVGPRPAEGYSLDRIDNDKPYGPGNVRWATRTVQNSNKSTNVNITWNGVTKTRTQWSESTGISRSLIRYRTRNGWSVERALSEPPFKGNLQSKSDSL